jgi:alpha-tubulin suppressor-like RCC1 family protein
MHARLADDRSMAWMGSFEIARWRRALPGFFALAATACPDDVAPVDTDSESGATASSTTTDATTVGATEGSGSTSGTSSDGIDTTADGSTGEPPPEVDPVPDPPGLATTSFASCRVDDDGTLSCWGEGGCGQLADGGDLARPPFVTAPERPWASVRAGRAHLCAIAEDRSLWCWGDARDGKIGDGILDDGLPFEQCRRTPVEVAPGGTWARLSLGEDHSCGVQTDGSLWCWGSNESAQIGDGAVGPLYTRLEPVEVGGTAWIDVYAGRAHTCGLEGDGSTWCWGLGGNGQLGQPDVPFSSTPLPVPGLPPLRELATGGTGSTTCGLDLDGAAWCWGANEYGATGTGGMEPVIEPAPVELPAPLAEIHVGSSTTCARSDDARLWCWGLGSNGQLGDGQTEPGYAVPTPVPIDGDDWIDVAIGARHVCGRSQAGPTWCWGANGSGQVGDGTSGPDNRRLQPVEVGPWGGGPVATDWAAGSLGTVHGCGLRQDGTMWCWGNRYRNQLGNDDALDGCSPASPYDCSFTTPVEVVPAGTAAWQAPTAGGDHTCARQDDGTLWCWGRNDAGQLGHGGDGSVPDVVGMETDWTLVRAGGSSTCGLRAPGTLWCWGANGSGQLGLGMTGGSEPAPVQVGADADWTEVALGEGDHGCGLRSGGSLWCWGRNDFGQLGVGLVGTPIPSPTAVAGTWIAAAIGSLHTCAIASDGSLWCWGLPSAALGLGPVDEGIPIDVPTQVGLDTDWVQVTAGSGFTCGRRSDGTLWCWGSNGSGQLGQGAVGSDLDADTPVQVGTESDWVDLHARGSGACGQRGSVLWCWGSGSAGRQGNDTIFTMGSLREVRDDG